MKLNLFLNLSACLLLFPLKFLNGAKVLFFCPIPAHSHQKMYTAVWKEMSLRGHKVFVVTPNPAFNKSMVNLTEYDISSVHEFQRLQIKPEWKEAVFKKPTFLGLIIRQFVLQYVGGDGMEYLYKHSEVKRLLKEHTNFDVCLFEWFHPAIAIYGHLFKCPTIGLGSNSLPIEMLDAVGNPSHPITAPEQDLPILRNTITFSERVWSTFWSIFSRLQHKFLLIPMEDTRIRKYYGADVPYLGKLERNLSLIILNRNPAFHRPIANVPSVIELGSIQYSSPSITINPDLKHFLDNSRQGVIYFSLGISMEGTSMPSKYFEKIQATFRSLPYSVLWKWESSSMPNKPDNVFIAKFVPQVSVLPGTVWVKLVTIVALVISVDAAKVLFLSCTPATSHQKPFQVIWRALSQRGHDVHVLTPNPLNDKTLTNLTEYDLSDFYEVIKSVQKGDVQYLLHRPTFSSSFIKDIFATKLFSRLYNMTLNHRETKRLIRENEHFDVVIVEWIFPTLASIAAFYKAPVIGMTSLGAPLVALDTLGNPSHPIVAPEMNLPLKRDLSFTERLLSVLYALYVRLHYKLVVLPREDKNIKQYLASDLPYIGEIEKNISVLLMNRNPVFHRVMPLFPNTVDLGGISLLSPISPLDSELKTFVEKSSKGVIYFSLGSVMQSVLLPPNTIETVRKVFKNLPYSFVWKWENYSMTDQPDNVYISKWIPQTALLEHPNVKLFITQGGLQSTEEAIAAHKPIIGIPFHSDQTTNVDTCVMYGMGKLVDLDDLTEEILRTYILDIMNNSSYAENAKKLDILMRDQPQDGVDKAIWWIEYVIRHKGARHLRSIAVDLPWWQYFAVDVLGFIFAIILASLLSICFTLKLMFRIIHSIRKPSQKLLKKEKKQ